ncbi:MAG TPA: radical SAM protein [Blastocatellia bacterium]|nr:radical SAM protein [Blastocatellia bacterium]
MHIGNRLHFIKSYLSKDVEVRHYPPALEIEVTNRCNEDCIMCPRSQITRPFGSMSMGLLDKILEEIAGRVELINLFHFGEPLLHPRLGEMIRRCKEARARVVITTNATLLNENKANELIDTGLDMLIISLDAASPDVYSKIRRLGDYTSVMENVESFLLLKDRAGKGPYTQVQMVSLRSNHHEIDAFVDRWKGKADSIRIKHFYNTANIGPTIDEPDIGRPSARPCVMLWREPVILCDGTVLPCCVDMIGEKPVGNINEKSLMEIWNDSEMVDMRQKHVDGKHHEIDICRNCHVFQFRWPFVVGSLLFNDMTLRKMSTVLENLETVKGAKKIRYS